MVGSNFFFFKWFYSLHRNEVQTIDGENIILLLMWTLLDT